MFKRVSYITFYFVLALSLIVSPFNVNAQSPKTILSKMSSAVQSFAAIQFDFNMKGYFNDGTTIEEFKGFIQAQGNSFRMINPYMSIYCDGESKWIHNIDAQELIIFKHDTTNLDIVENPIGFLISLDGSNSAYTISKEVKEDVIDGNPVWFIELIPVNRRIPYSGIVVAVKQDNYIPISFEYKAKDGSRYVAKLGSFRDMPIWDISNFTFPKERELNLEVTDLR